MALKLITPPTVEPITLAEAKAQCRVDGTDEDTYITSLIPAARRYCEGFQGRAYITQVLELWLDTWPWKDFIEIPRPMLQSVGSVKYYGTENTEYTMAEADYFVDDKSEPARLGLGYNKTWPSTTLRPHNGVVVRFTAGYGDTGASVPEEIKQAMLLLIGYWYDNRAAAAAGTVSKEVEFSTHALLWQDRIVSF